MSKNTNLSFLTDFLTADIVNSRVGMNNVSPQTTFDVTGTGKFSGVLTLGSTVSNGTYTYTLPSATGTLALVGGSGVGTVTSVAALTLGTSGTDLSSTVANGTTTPVITLNVPTASPTNRGALSAADWTTFNSKQNALTNPVTGTGTSGTIPVFTGSTTIGNSIVQSNATQVNVVGNGSQLLFDSLSSSKSGGIQYVNDFELLINNSRGSGSAIFLGNVNMDFHTNVSGNPRLRITDGGNILVGTTTDNGAKLQVNGGVTITNSAGVFTPSNYLQIEGSTANNSNYPGILFKGGTIATTYPSIALSNGGIALVLNQGNSASLPNTSQISLNNGAITLSTGSTLAPRLTVNELGNVGIGTISPSAAAGLAFVLNSDANQGRICIKTSATGDASGDGLQIGMSGIDAFIEQRENADLTLATNASERIRIKAGGNVLIGTTTDGGFKLNVNGTLKWGDSTTYVYSGADNTGMYMETVGTTTATRVLRIQGINNAGTTYSSIRLEAGISEIAFLTADTERMRINSSGNVTISGSGNTLLVSSNNNSLSIGVGFQGVTSGYIGGISSALYGYSTNGGYVLLNSSSVWVAASDAKRKRNFEPYTNGLSSILGLQPKLYNMDFQKDGDEKQVGLVAQEVKDFIPLAYEDNAGFIGLNYNAIIVTMVKAIQELKQQLDTLTNENN